MRAWSARLSSCSASRRSSGALAAAITLCRSATTVKLAVFCAVPGLPIDVLGGGFAVAPPSMGCCGDATSSCRAISLTFDRLPVARHSKSRESPHTTAIGQRGRIPEGEALAIRLFKHALETRAA